MLSILLAGLLLAAYPVTSQAASTQATKQTQAPSSAPRFELMTLPYATDALVPVISRQTVELHHGKHLQGYVNNLNRLKQGTEFEHETDLVYIVKHSKGSIFDNAGQLLNHNLYFSQFSPKPRDLSGDLARAIAAEWGDEERFRAAFEREGMSLFGSGWLWLATDKAGKLQIVREANGSNPVVRDLTPLLGIDLWEHAYYLDYQNRRADHLRAIWRIVDWHIVAERYSKR